MKMFGAMGAIFAMLTLILISFGTCSSEPAPCPDAGTVIEDVCYYGEQWDNNTCIIMQCKFLDGYSSCDPEYGCIECIPEGTFIDTFSNGNSSFEVKLNGIVPGIPKLFLPDGYRVFNATMRVTGKPADITRQKTSDIIIVDDISGSMNDDCGSDGYADPGEHPCKINDKKSADIEFINLVLGDGMSNKIGLVAYNTMVKDSVPLTDDNESLIEHVNAYKVSGRTCISCGINEAIKLLAGGSNTSRAIVLMSDGIANRCMNDTTCTEDEAISEAIEMAREAWENHHARVFSIAFGNDADKETMQKIAEVGNGIYYFADNGIIVDVQNQIAYEIFNSYPVDPALDVGSDSVIDWSYPGEFNTSEFVPDFGQALDGFLGCDCNGCALHPSAQDR